MAAVNIRAVFPYDIQKVWGIVTSLENTSWRSDLDRVEIINERQFVEYAKGGYATTFTITTEKDLERWEFDMENGNMKGHWTGVFSQENGQTAVDFTEDVTVKKPVMKLFIKAYLKRQQRTYIEDLRKALEGA
ncbi:MAG: SRPBCC family protein [Muribaculaceae bacterium]|nr:SRPBCC family protein [Roseburia sp.]MCM1432262.1 SRPBCC family protein [Muribaculaceae bacterium]MCM1493999.1 SRPBCC family protein [Muribaculaceae bacterium]MCM1561060.1 SRPBCC family protein [Butyrivibrio sp.]